MKNTNLVILYTALFIIFLLPFSITLSNEDGASANYFFLLFPLVIGLREKTFVKPKLFWTISIIIFFLIFLISLSYQISYFQFFIRRLISFILFMSIFSFLFIKIDENMISAFKNAIIFVSFMFSIFTFYTFIKLGGSDLGYSAKGEVGSQRYGFVYVLALWLLFYDNNYKKIIKFFFLITITIGLLLTFSRSGIIAMILSSFFLWTFSIYSWILRPNLKGILIGTLIIFFLISTLIFINIQYPIFFDFFNQRLFSYFEKGGSTNLDLDQDSSEGYRVYMLNKVFNFVIYNPLTGAGFLGVWILFEDQSGSAHGQFVDVFFRTGFIGFITYLIILNKLLINFFKSNKGLFWGIVAIIIYGFFHETFKLSQGTFILAFLIGQTSQNNKTIQNIF
jgi:hypothetical protein